MMSRSMISAYRLASTGLFVLFAAASAYAQAAAPTDTSAIEISTTLEQWRLDFNKRKPDRICDLFAPDLRYDFQGLPEQDFEQLCDRLHRALADTTKTFQYGLHIKEIIVAEPMAVVRLTWTSTLTTGAKSTTDEETGLDVFWRQPDRSWKILRYMAFPANP
jgi:hypothetical protein